MKYHLIIYLWLLIRFNCSTSINA